MTKHLLVVAALVGALLTGPAGAAPPPEGVPGNEIFSGGGTPLTNGIFFPGTALCEDKKCEPVGPVLEVSKGSDINFTNVDEGAVSNAHRIVCLKKNKKGRPKCVSDQLDSPGESSRMITSKLKPGRYFYYCSIHAGMFGVFDIVKS